MARKRNAHKSHSSAAGPAWSVVSRERMWGAVCMCVCMYERENREKQNSDGEERSNGECYYSAHAHVECAALYLLEDKVKEDKCEMCTRITKFFKSILVIWGQYLFVHHQKKIIKTFIFATFVHLCVAMWE